MRKRKEVNIMVYPEDVKKGNRFKLCRREWFSGGASKSNPRLPPTRKSKRLIPILVVFCPIFNEKPTALSKLIAVIVAVEGMCAVLV